ncbi:23S rRNA (adenine(2030)-N(6))-methyltransferase RlmJ [Nitrincola sp. MINF-07-Sa-05]|uniref:23S rRNA (adenine(2030)-N(6))-methyltransferase RlmJ n=1 Tax=Nitrincola salilacus TaxID=3400273 RepID=UPI00391827F6
MLSYLHGFHAGNFADIHKHFILSCLLQSLNRKATPWNYLETHSGRAIYDLENEQALKTSEFKEGIVRLWEQQDLPEQVQPYLDSVRQWNPDGSLKQYPGSPSIAAGFAREQDRLHLMELHPTEFDVLKRTFRRDERVAVHHRDGYEGVLSLLPPTPNRGLVLIDPSYEVKSEYDQVVSFMLAATRRWPNGIYAIWYPLLGARRWQEMLDALSRSGIRKILRSEVEIAPEAERGMYGSGMLIINPPWQLDQQLEASLPMLKDSLEQGQYSTLCDWLVPE